MILGDTLTAVSLGIERMTQELVSGRNTVEMILAWGGTRWEAAQGAARQPVRAGMMPTLNPMTVVGIVSLPGMMTGQVLAGENPIEAARYQMVISDRGRFSAGHGRRGTADVQAAVLGRSPLHAS